jgi:FkbM family methyltransferase
MSRGGPGFPLAIAVAALLGWGACGSESDEPSRRDILATEQKRYSQFDEELVIRDFFQDRRGGTFVDVGSGPPIRGSTTYYLEKHLGWSGLGVDALPEYAKPYAQRRSRTSFKNFIVTDHSGTVEKFYRVAGAPGLSSTIPDRMFRGQKLAAETIEIPTITLDELLASEGIERFDFLSMDIEGGAPKALAGLDIERFAPELVCIEPCSTTSRGTATSGSSATGRRTRSTGTSVAPTEVRWPPPSRA